MDIASMHELINMIQDLDQQTAEGCKRWIADWTFCEDGKSIWVQLSNGNEYHFSV